MAGTYTPDEGNKANLAGMMVALYTCVLDTTCAVKVRFSIILGAQATYGPSAVAAQALVVSWSGTTVTVTGGAGSTDTVYLTVYGLI